MSGKRQAWDVPPRRDPPDRGVVCSDRPAWLLSGTERVRPALLGGPERVRFNTLPPFFGSQTFRKT